MSTVKFGNTAHDENGNQIVRKFGKNLDRITFWKFGQPSKFYIYDLLLKYLPKFVVKNDLLKHFMRSIAIPLVKWENKLYALKNIEISGGKPSLKFANEDCQIFISPNASDDKIINAIKDYFNIHERRGTAAGIIEDIKRLTNDDGATVTYKNYNQCGWFLDVTFPEYNNATQLGLESTCFLDLDNLLIIKYKNKSGYSDKEVSRIIREEFIPRVINIREIVSKPHIIKYGETKNGFKIKFGTFKFGEIKE